MKDKMSDKEIQKIEDKLSDTDVPDSVLNLARAEMSKSRKPALRKFNLKIVLSCAASFALCLAIILPVTLSVFGSKDSGKPDYSDNDSSSENFPPAGDVIAEYSLQDLKKDIVYSYIGDNDGTEGDNNGKPPEDNNVSIVKLSKIDYSYDGIKILSEETYTVYDCECVVYTLYNAASKVDVLTQFNHYAEEYVVGNVKVNYKISDGNYIAETVCNNYRYCFTGTFSEKAVFEELCFYLFEKN